ncbi:Cytochrome c-554 [bacterium HR36]|nr:Cytochrome c-554 [bacterium HR36]
MPRVGERLAIVGLLFATPVAVVVTAGGYYWWAENVKEEPRLVARRAVNPRYDPAEQVRRAWQEPPPELVLAFSGQMYGYLQPCGCSRPQVGGLERRYELTQRLRQFGWPVVGFDLGDLARLRYEIKQGVPALVEQARLKYETAWKMLHHLGWQAVGLGPEELLFPLEEVLGWALNTRPPTLIGTNLDWPEMHEVAAYQRFLLLEIPTDLSPSSPSQLLVPQPIFSTSPGAAASSGRSSPRRTWRVACLSVIQESQLKKLREQAPKELLQRFSPAEVALANAWRDLSRRRPNLVILLHHGTPEEAKQLAQKFGWIHIIVNRDETDVASTLADELPSAGLDSLPNYPSFLNRLLIRVGHKGKAVGLVAVRSSRSPSFPDPDALPAYRFDYRMVELIESLEPISDGSNPVRELMKEYVYQVYARQLLQQWVAQRQVSHQQQLDQPGAAFVGAAACAECHRSACQVWNNSKHSQAYAALAKYGQPHIVLQRNGRSVTIGRQYDPECLICHTTGFEYKTGFRSETETPHLLANGCENCHGPASLHVQFPKEAKYWQPLQRKASANLCISCHDSENDPHFDFAKYWPKIMHKKD